jgi:UDP-N-acetylmuramyl pentapeptide phosphotransferase/UDP-N-acetylglucosamine-1-phosphate transferase
MPVAASAAIAAIAALVCAGLIVIIRPWLERYALAHPNRRSSHTAPTPQGGGVAVIVAALAVSCAASFFVSAVGQTAAPASLVVAVILMAGVGAMADFYAVNVAPRLLLQALAVALVIYTLPAELRCLPFLPAWIERILLLVGGLWFVNLVNFMDGLDWMTVAEVVPVTAAIAAIGALGLLPAPAIIASLALCGAMIGFAYFNRPVAKLFLGDVGSLPIGLVLGWLLVLLAGNGARAAAVLLPLYYVADSTITLLRRLRNGERIWQAHRTHYYQRATVAGYSVRQVVARVFAVNLALGALAITTIIFRGAMTEIAAVVAGGVIVAWLLVVFARGPRAPSRAATF